MVGCLEGDANRLKKWVEKLGAGLGCIPIVSDSQEVKIEIS